MASASDVRYIALLDVLGFSALVASDRDGVRLGEYLDALTLAVTGHESSATIEYLAFSDTVILTSPDATDEAFNSLVVACARCMNLLLKKQVAVRGAIARGHVLVKKAGNNTFVAGSAVVDAYRYEQLQDWVGIMLAPSARAALPRLEISCEVSAPNSDVDVADLAARLPLAGCLRICHGIPFHASH